MAQAKVFTKDSILQVMKSGEWVSDREILVRLQENGYVGTTFLNSYLLALQSSGHIERKPTDPKDASRRGHFEFSLKVSSQNAFADKAPAVEKPSANAPVKQEADFSDLLKDDEGLKS